VAHTTAQYTGARWKAGVEVAALAVNISSTRMFWMHPSDVRIAVASTETYKLPLYVVIPCLRTPDSPSAEPTGAKELRLSVHVVDRFTLATLAQVDTFTLPPLKASIHAAWRPFGYVDEDMLTHLPSPTTGGRKNSAARGCLRRLGGGRMKINQNHQNQNPSHRSVPQYIRARYCKGFKKTWDKTEGLILRCRRT
jgi:hypothetical protein